MGLCRGCSSSRLSGLQPRLAADRNCWAAGAGGACALIGLRPFIFAVSMAAVQTTVPCWHSSHYLLPSVLCISGNPHYG